MGNAFAWFIAVMLLSLSGSGCSRSGESRERTAELTALDQAYQSGVLNKDEYAVKKAGLESQAEALDALDRARWEDNWRRRRTGVYLQPARESRIEILANRRFV